MKVFIKSKNGECPKKYGCCCFNLSPLNKPHRPGVKVSSRLPCSAIARSRYERDRDESELPPVFPPFYSLIRNHSITLSSSLSSSISLTLSIPPMPLPRFPLTTSNERAKISTSHFHSLYTSFRSWYSFCDSLLISSSTVRLLSRSLFRWWWSILTW